MAHSIGSKFQDPGAERATRPLNVQGIDLQAKCALCDSDLDLVRVRLSVQPLKGNGTERATSRWDNEVRVEVKWRIHDS